MPVRSQSNARQPALTFHQGDGETTGNDSASLMDLIWARGETPVWVGADQTIKVHGFTLNGPMTYFCSGTKGDEEPGAVNVRLPLSGRELYDRWYINFVNSYKEFGGASREGYLQWLAGGRTDSSVAPVFPALYLFGVERRLLIDGQDHLLLWDELVRLAETDRGMLQFYASDLIGYSMAVLQRQGALATVGQVPDRVLEFLLPKEVCLPCSATELSSGALAAGVYLAASKKPLPAPFARRLAACHHDASRSTVMDRMPADLATLFDLRYAAEFGEGMILKAGSRRYPIQYSPRSSCRALRRVVLSSEVATLPNALPGQKDLLALVNLYNGCIDSLRPASRQRGMGWERASSKVWEALPPEIRRNEEHPLSRPWQDVASRYAAEDGLSIVPVREIVSSVDDRVSDKISLSMSRSLATTAEMLGFAIEPDARVTGRAYDVSDGVFLLRRDPLKDGVDGLDHVGARCLLAIAIRCPAIGDSPEVREQIAGFLIDRMKPTGLDLRRITGLARFLTAESSERLYGRLLQAHLAPDVRSDCFALCLAIAAEKTPMDSDRLNDLIRLGTAFRLARRHIEDLISDILYPMGACGPPVRPGEPIHRGPVEIDWNRVHAIFGESQEVAAILVEATRDSPEPDTPTDEEAAGKAGQTVPVEPEKPAEDERFPGLPARYQPLLTAALETAGESGFVSADAMGAMARRYGLFSQAAIEAINEWAMESLGELVIEADGSRGIRIYTDLLEESSRA